MYELGIRVLKETVGGILGREAIEGSPRARGRGLLLPSRLDRPFGPRFARGQDARV